MVKSDANRMLRREKASLCEEATPRETKERRIERREHGVNITTITFFFDDG